MGKPKESPPLEKTLWKAADKLRKNMDAAEYKHIVLGLIFLKYISDSFNDLYTTLQRGAGDYQGADPEDPKHYQAQHIFFVPKIARWSYLQNRATQPQIGTDINKAMRTIETQNAILKGVLPQVYTRPNLDSHSLASLIDLVSTIAMGHKQIHTQDMLGRVYEYFLGQFALTEGRRGGQFYTPDSIVKLLVAMLEPYQGRVYDPCCGSGGMFVQSEKFVESHQGHLADIAIYGQESNQTTWRLCKMNLAIRGIDSTNVIWNNEGSFLKNAHPTLKADFILANPPFNDSDWGSEHLRHDNRWQYGPPPNNNANFGWVQHFLYHLAPHGRAGFVLSNGSLSSNKGGEGIIRQKMVDDNLLDCIVMLPTKLFYNTGIPACLWFISRHKNSNKNRARPGEILFIDASDLGTMLNRRNRIFSQADIQKISTTYHQWLVGKRDYKDIKGFCKSAPLEMVKKYKYVLTPGRYVGIPPEKDDGIPFEKKMADLGATLAQQMQESHKLDEEIKTQLAKVGIIL